MPDLGERVAAAAGRVGDAAVTAYGVVVLSIGALVPVAYGAVGGDLSRDIAGLLGVEGDAAFPEPVAGYTFDALVLQLSLATLGMAFAAFLLVERTYSR